MKYLKQFIIGASYPVFILYYLAVYNSQSKKNYSYYEYTLVAPLWFGFWNVISLIIATKYNLSMRQRFLLISIVSALSIMVIATLSKSYDFTTPEWLTYYGYILLKYLFVWNVIIYFIETNIS